MSRTESPSGLTTSRPRRTATWLRVVRAHGHGYRDDMVARSTWTGSGRGPTERMAYLSGFGAGGGWVAIRGVAAGLGVAMAWDVATFPHAWFWWEIGGPGHPWHGRSRIVAVEPHTAVPSDGLAAADARGDAHRLEPGQTHQTWLTIRLFDADDRPVRAVAQDGDVTR